MHTHQFFTWITHSREHTTLLGQHTLQRTQLYKTTRSSTHMYNIVTELVTEFYLYSIIYIYLINSRLDVTYSVRHHFRTVNFINSYTRAAANAKRRIKFVLNIEMSLVSRDFCCWTLMCVHH